MTRPEIDTAPHGTHLEPKYSTTMALKNAWEIVATENILSAGLPVFYNREHVLVYHRYGRIYLTLFM